MIMANNSFVKDIQALIDELSEAKSVKIVVDYDRREVYIYFTFNKPHYVAYSWGDAEDIETASELARQVKSSAYRNVINFPDDGHWQKQFYVCLASMAIDDMLAIACVLSGKYDLIQSQTKFIEIPT